MLPAEKALATLWGHAWWSEAWQHACWEAGAVTGRSNHGLRHAWAGGRTATCESQTMARVAVLRWHHTHRGWPTATAGREGPPGLRGARPFMCARVALTAHGVVSVAALAAAIAAHTVCCHSVTMAGSMGGAPAEGTAYRRHHLLGLSYRTDWHGHTEGAEKLNLVGRCLQGFSLLGLEPKSMVMPQVRSTCMQSQSLYLPFLVTVAWMPCILSLEV